MDSVQARGSTPDGRYVVSGSSDHRLHLWDVKDGNVKNAKKEILTFTLDATVTACIAAQDNGQSLPEMVSDDCISCGSSKQTKLSLQSAIQRSSF
jgi:WD40 repeat protein